MILNYKLGYEQKIKNEFYTIFRFKSLRTRSFLNLVARILKSPARFCYSSLEFSSLLLVFDTRRSDFAASRSFLVPVARILQSLARFLISSLGF